MGIYRSNDRDGPPVVLFEYQTTRAGKHAQVFLRDFSGPYLQVDAYAGYNKIQSTA